MSSIFHSLAPDLFLHTVDIGNLAKWTVSSRKFGFGMQFLRDDDPDTYWQ
jgi:hypothetical protein